MQPSVKIGFRQELLELPLKYLVALKETEPNAFKGRKYKQLEASLQHVGLIEPLAVFPQAEGPISRYQRESEARHIEEAGHSEGTLYRRTR